MKAMKARSGKFLQVKFVCICMVLQAARLGQENASRRFLARCISELVSMCSELFVSVLFLFGFGFVWFCLFVCLWIATGHCGI